jgi:hypothetical protein
MPPDVEPIDELDLRRAALFAAGGQGLRNNGRVEAASGLEKVGMKRKGPPLLGLCTFPSLAPQDLDIIPG